MTGKAPTATRRKRKQLGPRGNLLTSVVFVLPLLVFYEIGVLSASTLNGADLITQTLLRLVGSTNFIYVQLGLLGVMAILALYLRRTQQFELRQIGAVLLESGIYAATMGTLIVFVMVDLLGIDPRLAAGGVAEASVFERLVISAGAGVHEELVFRLGIMGGLILLFERGLAQKPWIALVAAILISSVLFSLAHHLGPGGEPLRLGVFVYRTFAGIFFALLFRYRSFAIAVYTHTLYDVYVLLLR